jgi:hypothetical protein
VKNILFNSAFRVLYESELFTTKKKVSEEKKRVIQRQKMAFYPIQHLSAA